MSGAERGGGSAPLFSPPPPWGAAHGPQPCPPSPPAHPPCVYKGRRAAVGAGRGPVRCRWVGAGGEGRFPRYGLLPCLPQSGIKAGRLVCAFSGATVLSRPTAPAQSRRPAVGYAEVSGRPTEGAWRAAAFATAVASPPWVLRPLRGVAGPQSLWPASGRARARVGGEGGREGAGGGGVPRFPPLAPWRRPPTAAGERPGGSGPGGPAADLGGILFPHLPLTLRCRTLAHALARVPCSPRRRPAVPAGRGGGAVCAGGGVPDQRSAVSGLRGSGPLLMPSAPVLPPTGGGARPSAALYGGGVWVGGPGSAGGGVPRYCHLPPPHAHRLGRWGAAVTAIVACVVAGAAAVAGSAGGSASG